MKKHIILEKAERYSLANAIGVPKGFTYENLKGYWVNKQDGKALVNCDGPNIPTSKKFDMETGEDHKGE